MLLFWGSLQKRTRPSGKAGTGESPGIHPTFETNKNVAILVQTITKKRHFEIN
jgi:hypothetical protein